MAESKTEKMRKLFEDKQLDEEMLEGVAGGNDGGVSDDSLFLNVLLRGCPGQCDRYGIYKCQNMYIRGKIVDEVTTAWASVGIKAELHLNKKNRYFDAASGREMTRGQAYSFAEKVVGKKLKKSDWYWD